MLLLPLILVLASLVWAVFIYNRLVAYRNEAERSWAQVDVQLKLRHDLLPKLVEVVKGAMEFEKGTLTAIVEARGKALAGTGQGLPTAGQVQAEAALTPLLGRFFGLWEKYPELKSNSSAMDLQHEVSRVEERIAYARTHYNGVVANYNTLLQQVPDTWVAGLAQCKALPYFEAPEGDRADPVLDLAR
jgi:LemA protein